MQNMLYEPGTYGHHKETRWKKKGICLFFITNKTGKSLSTYSDIMGLLLPEV